MKNILFILGMIVLPMLLVAQSKQGVNNFFQKYKNHEGAEQFKLGGLILNLATSFSGDPDSKHLLRKMKRIRLLNIDSSNPVDPADYKQLLKDIESDDYSPLIKVKEDGEQIDIYVQEKHEHITDIIILVNGIDDFLLLNLEGKFKFEDLNDLDIDVDGGEQLKRLPDDKDKLNRA